MTLDSEVQSSATRRVIVGVDGSTNSIRALRWASQLSDHVVAVSVWNQPAAAMVPALGVAAPPSAMLEGVAEQRLHAAVVEVGGTTSVTERVVMGSARNVLVSLSADADLIVVGRTGHGRVTRALLGSTAAACARHTHCPVAIIGDNGPDLDRAQVAVDGSAHSLAALQWTLGLPIHRDVTAIYSHDESILDELALDDHLRLEYQRAAEAHVGEAVDRALVDRGDVSSELRVRVLTGDPRTTIVDLADPAALLVLGAQGHQGLEGRLLGSLADYAVGHAPCSVVVVR